MFDMERKSDFGCSLDPADWRATRAQAHRMLDDILDYVEHIRERPVWQPIPDAVRARFPRTAAGSAEPIWPPSTTNSCASSCPTPPATCIPASWAGCMAAARWRGCWREMLAAGLNANLGGRDHVPIEVERQIVALDAPASSAFPETRQRALRHRHLDGQSASACWWRALRRSAPACGAHGLPRAGRG